jgi:hypothetical protein
MSAVSEQDLELLESWLDGELSDEQVEALRRRVSSEPQLSAVVDRLRGDRQTRAAVWQSINFSNHNVDHLIHNVRIAVRRDEVWTGRLRALRSVSGIAAAIAMVFTAGWISARKLHVGSIPDQINLASPIVAITSSDQLQTAPQAQAVSQQQPGRTVIPVDHNGVSLVRPTYKVIVTDPVGRGVIIRELDNLYDAKQLGEELVAFNRTHQPATQRPDGSEQSPPVNVNHQQP